MIRREGESLILENSSSNNRCDMNTIMKIFVILCVLVSLCTFSLCNPDAKRLYDDLLSNYNRLIRPVSNNTDTVLVKLGLRLSQLIELVRIFCSQLESCSKCLVLTEKRKIFYSIRKRKKYLLN